MQDQNTFLEDARSNSLGHFVKRPGALPGNGQAVREPPLHLELVFKEYPLIQQETIQFEFPDMELSNTELTNNE